MKSWRVEVETCCSGTEYEYTEFVLVGDDSTPGDPEGSEYEAARFYCEDDARLAARAPQLLAALTSFVASYHAGGVPPFSVVEAAERVIEKARDPRGAGET